MLIDLINQINTDFKHLLKNKYLNDVNDKLIEQYNTFEGEIPIYPPKNLIFNAFNHFNIKDCKVVILGQDPYINENEAMGLCFSVPTNCKIPPSLKNIFKELEIEFGVLRNNPDLTDWVKQGVLLMNSSLTVLSGKSNSHSKIWTKYTDEIIHQLSLLNPNIIYILWGNNAINKKELINNNSYILTGVHPSPLSAHRGFFGNNHFKLVNEKLDNPINWIG